MIAGPAVRQATAADAPALAALFIEAWRDEHDGLLPEAVLAARSAAVSETNWRRTLTRVGPASDRSTVLIVGERPLEGLVVGVLRAPEWPGAAEVALVQVARAARRRGVGAALIRALAARLRSEGAGSLIVRVLEANEGARRFYEALGGQLAPDVRQVEESGFSFAERVYVWPDIARIAPPLAREHERPTQA